MFCIVAATLLVTLAGSGVAAAAPSARSSALRARFEDAGFPRLVAAAKQALAQPSAMQRRQGSTPTPPGYPGNFKAHTFTEYVYKPDPQGDYYAEGFTYHDDALMELRNDMEFYFQNDLQRDYTSSKTLSKELIHDIQAPGIGDLGAPTTCAVYEHMPEIPIIGAWAYVGVQFVNWEACDTWIEFDVTTNTTVIVWMDMRNSNPVATYFDSPFDITTIWFDPMFITVDDVEQIEFVVPARANCQLKRIDAAAAAVAPIDPATRLFGLVQSLSRK